MALLVLSGFTLMMPGTGFTEMEDRTEPLVLDVGTQGGFHTIRAALDYAVDGDTIQLAPGVYNEFVHIDKSVWLRGAVPQSLPTDGPEDGVQYETGSHRLVTRGIMVTADNAKISGVTLANIWGVPDGRDYNNPDWRPFPWNSAGIITMAWGGNANGVVEGLSVDSVTFTNCWQGVFLFGAKGATVQNCVFRDCYRGITIKDHFYSPTKTWVSANNQILDCQFYDSLFDHPDLTPEEQASENGEAISIQNCDNNRVQRCTMDGNTFGVSLYRGSQNLILQNTISNTTVNPLMIREVADGVTVTGNTFIEEGKDVRFYKCNDFIFNNNKMDGVTLELMNSTLGKIRDNQWEQTETPALSFGTLDKHFDHDIGQSNQIGGEPIYYFYNEGRLSLSSVDAGAVYVMECDDGILADLKVIGGDGIVVTKSENMTIERVTATNNLFGIDVSDAIDLVIRETVTDTGSRGKFGVRLHNITNASYEDGEVRTYGTEDSVRLTGGTHCTLWNSTFDGDNVQVMRNEGGVLEVSNPLRVRIMENGSIVPFEGGHVLITQDSTPVYSTRYYGGTDPVTDATGVVGPVELVDRVYHGTNVAIERFHSVQVFAEVDGMWSESRPNLDMSSSRIERFEISDIWAPGSPINVRVKDLPDEDAMEVSWFPPIDADTDMVSLYLQEGDDWREVGSFPDTITYHKITEGLVHGETYNFRLTAWDNEGLESLPTPEHGVVHIDGVTPPAPSDLLASNVTAFSCQLDWTAVPDADLVGYHVYMNDTGVGPTGPWVKVSPKSGVSSNAFQVTGLASETTYFFAVSAFDEVPNESPHSPTIKVDTPDVTPPARPVLDPLPAYTNVKQQTVAGVSEAGVNVAVFIDGEEVGSARADDESRFELEVNLTEGPNVISARATDLFGNVGRFSREVTVVLDTSVPDAPLLDPMPELTNDVNLLVSGLAEDGSTVTLFVDGIEAGTTESIQYVGFSSHVTLTEGLNAICAQALDRAGNLGPKCTDVEVVLDTVPPLEPELDDLPSITNDPAITVSGVAEPDSTVEVYLEDYMAGTSTADGGGRFTVDIGLLEGDNYLMVRCIDLARNPSRATLPVEILLDTVPPIPYLGEDMEVVEDTEVTFDGSTSYDNQGIVGYLWAFDADGVDETMEDTTFTYTFDHPMEVLMTLTLTDVAGNEATGSVTVNVVSSNRAPEMTLGMVDPPEGHTETEYTFSVRFWDADGDLGTVNVVVDGSTHAMVPDPADTDSLDGVVYTYTTTLKEGDHVYYFTGEDPLGLEATGPCVGDDNTRTMTVYQREKAGVPGMGAVLAAGAITLLGTALIARRRREVMK